MLKFQSQFGIFLLVGVLNTLFGYSIYAVFIYLGLAYPLAALLSTGLGIAFNFKTTGKFVFNNSDPKRIFKFIAVYGFLYLFSIALIKVLSFISGNLYVDGFIAIIFSALMGFILNKHIVFKEAHEIN